MNSNSDSSTYSLIPRPRVQRQAMQIKTNECGTMYLYYKFSKNFVQL